MVELIKKHMSLDFHIKSLYMEVNKHTPFYVVWSRSISYLITLILIDNKKANTKVKLLNENVHQAIIDEKFQISTFIDVNE